MSPRAAWRLEHLGFDEVYDYVAGKADWIAAGLPSVRRAQGERRAIDALDRTVATAVVGQRAGDVARPAGRSVIVINDAGVVLGRADDDRLTANPDREVDTLMTGGPTTVRAHEPLDALRDRMRRRRVRHMIVTTPEGRLVGVVDAEGE